MTRLQLRRDARARPLLLTAVLAVLALGLAACGDDSDERSDSSSTGSPDGSGNTEGADRAESGAADGIRYPESFAAGVPVVEIYTDFQCPACQSFDEAYLDPLIAAADAGELNLVFRQFSFLDRASQNEYSSRSANAALCVYSEGRSPAYVDYYRALFAQQPTEGTAGPEDDDLIDLAATAGVDGIDDCVTGRTFAHEVEKAADAASDAGVSGTPALVVDGELIDAVDIQSVLDDLLA